MKRYSVLLAGVLATALVPAVAFADYGHDDQIEQQVYTDADFGQNKQKAIELLEQRGYSVRDVSADAYRGRPALQIEAYKNGKEYEVIMKYPSLKILKLKQDR